MSVRLHCRHVTTYRYSSSALQCQNHLRLTPRTTERQRLLESAIEIDPEPEPSTCFVDYFGNRVHSFRVSRGHAKLVIAATSVTEISPLPPLAPAGTMPWEQVREAVEDARGADTFEAAQFLYDSPRVRRAPAFIDYARRSFAPERPVLEAALDLNHRIHEEFEYESGSTEVDTPVEEALKARVGVCQDFAHVMAGCFRSLGIPARYVSGYLKSSPKFVGDEASHAWVAVYCPGLGWIDLDPTNDLVPSLDHITLAWGRDYGDVPPVKGITLGGGQQEIEVGVGVTADPPSAS